MKISTQFRRKASVIMLTPVFALLAACGGGAEAPVDAAAAEISVHPENHLQESSASAQSSAMDTVENGAVRPSDYEPSASPAVIGGANNEAAPASQEQGTITSSPMSNEPVVQPNQFYATSVSVAAGGRDPLKQPFASNSIWNMPLGSGAIYVPAKLSANPGNNIWAAMPGIDDEKIIMKPTSPLVSVNHSNAGWTGKNRCTATGSLLFKVPMPSTYVVPNTNKNSSAAFLMPDRRTIVQTQPLARCTSGGSATSMAKFSNVDLYGTGITGAHGGSGLSAIGGSIRLGELRPGTTTGPRHALKVNVYAKEALYKCTTRAACSRWPAVNSDSYAVGWYGSANRNSNTAMKMGALLAIHPSTSIASLGLETMPAKQLAWTLQNYGAYIVDDTYAAGFDFNVEDGPDGSKKDEFRKDWGFDMAQRVQGNTAWVRDIQRLVKALHVVNNNGPTSIGGGGTPRQPLALPIAP